MFLTNHYLPFCLYQAHLRASIITTTSLTSQIILLTWPFKRMSLTCRREADEKSFSTIHNACFYIFIAIFIFLTQCVNFFYFRARRAKCSFLTFYPHFFPIDSMNEKDCGAIASTSADNGISTSSNVKHPARRSRICKKCSRSVKIVVSTSKKYMACRKCGVSLMVI